MLQLSDARSWAGRSAWYDRHVGIVRDSEERSGFRVQKDVLKAFGDFLSVNMRLEQCTVKETLLNIRRFLENADYVVSVESVKRYLESYIPKKPKTYNSQITSLRRFIKEFLEMPDMIMSYKMAAVDEWHFNENLPSKENVKKGFQGLTTTKAKAIYLFTVTTGLRKGEILNVLKSQANKETRSVIPKHFTRKKRSGITFYNEETALWLEKYLSERKDNSEKLFVISDRAWRRIWIRASKAAGVTITSKILRAWFSTEMGELGVPDRFVDVFQGRAPRRVLAKHYTGKGIETLKRIYEKANFKVLEL
jgi:intergrase/recombinase